MGKVEKTTMVLNYVKSSVKKGIYPKGSELHKKFRIYDDLNLNMKDIYRILGVNLLLVPNKPAQTKEEVKKLLIEYVKNEVKKKHYPSRREIENNFHVRLQGIFDGIENLYKEAKISYRRIENQDIKYKKAKKFLEVIVKILKKNKFKVVQIKNPNQQGIDVIISLSKKKIIGIELKAYNQFERVKMKDIKQLEKFYKNNDFKEIWLLTTSSRVPKEIPKWLNIMKYEDLKKWCYKEELQTLKEIRKKSVHQDTPHRLQKKQLIINYIRKNGQKGKFVGARNINDDLRLYVYSYFKNMDEIYKMAEIDIPLSRLWHMRDKKFKEEVKQKNLEKILAFIKSEIKKGHFPSGEDIGKAFDYSHIWNRYKVNDLYKMLGLPTYLERKSSGLS